MFSKIATALVVLQIAALANGKSKYLQAVMPSSCDKNYCFDRSTHYPQTLIDKLMEKENLIETVEDFGHRDGESTRDDDCTARIFFNHIYEIIDHNDTVRYVVQTSDGAKRAFRQKLRMEVCENPGKITESTQNLDLESSWLMPYEFYCHQTVIDYSFLVISLDGQRIEAVKAKGGIPVCCKCVVKERNDY